MIARSQVFEIYLDLGKLLLTLGCRRELWGRCTVCSAKPLNNQAEVETIAAIIGIVLQLIWQCMVVNERRAMVS